MSHLLLATMFVGLVGDIDEPHPNSAVMLEDYAPCGVVSLFLAARMRNVPTSLEQVSELVGPLGPDRTHSFEDLSKAARELGMMPIGLRADRLALRTLPLPAIVQIRDPTHPEAEMIRKVPRMSS